MSEQEGTDLSLENAVARLVNLDYIPEGFSVLDMTSAFREEAEVEYENARSDGLPVDELRTLKLRLDTCSARHKLAQALLASIRDEFSLRAENDDPSGGTPMVEFRAVQDWARDRFDIAISTTSPESPIKARWDDVTIKIYAEYRIGWRTGEGQFQRSSFQEIGLMGKRKHVPNHQGEILFRLSRDRKFPSGKRANKDSAAISRLGGALKALTGIDADPFYRFNEADGWKPRFKLIDDTRNADQRAKDRAIHVPFDETRDFEEEDDEGANFLREHE